MWFSFVLLSLTAASVSIAERCDGAHPPKTFKCADVPDIMALQTDKCQPYHMFIGRGTDERAPGRPGNITKLVCDQLGGPEKCGWENIEYPAKNRFISNDTWCKSADIGARNGQAQLKAYAERCPDSQFILMGYSQGGSIIQDIMGGGGGPIFKCEQSMNAPYDRSKSPGKNIVAAITAGTVRRVSSESYSVGPGKDFLSEGRRSDEQRLALHPYADVIQDYCNEHDPICANSSHDLNLEFHLTYWELYQKEMVDFIVKKVREKERKSHKLRPLLHQLPTHYWLTGALLFSLALSWLALYCYTSFRRRISGGVLSLPKGMGFAA